MRSGGKLVVISGPSGAGKTSVCRALKKFPNVVFSISATTRPMRTGEKDGVDYHFVTPEDFERRVSAGEFLESARYRDSRYGTLRGPMDEALAKGQVFVVEIEVQGTRQLRDSGAEGIYVMVVPPGPEVLRERLVGRGTDTMEEIERRIAIAEEEMKAVDLYDHVVVNDDLERTIAEIVAIIGL